MLHGRMKVGRKQKYDAGLLQYSSRRRRIEHDPEAKCFEHVRGPAARRIRAIAMFGDNRARAGGDECRDGRNVER